MWCNKVCYRTGLAEIKLWTLCLLFNFPTIKQVIPKRVDIYAWCLLHSPRIIDQVQSHSPQTTENQSIYLFN